MIKRICCQCCTGLLVCLLIISMCGCYLLIPKDIVDSEAADYAAVSTALDKIDAGEMDNEAAVQLLKQLEKDMLARLYAMQGQKPPEDEQ